MSARYTNIFRYECMIIFHATDLLQVVKPVCCSGFASSNTKGSRLFLLAHNWFLLLPAKTTEYLSLHMVKFMLCNSGF